MGVTKIVEDILKDLCGEETIDLSANLQTDLALDSLMMVTLLVEIEDRFCIELDEADMNPFELDTVTSVIELVERYGVNNEED